LNVLCFYHVYIKCTESVGLVFVPLLVLFILDKLLLVSVSRHFGFSNLFSIFFYSLSYRVFGIHPNSDKFLFIY
jgi:hypothetical protein